ncbi:hypothetical protein D8674_021735 [Pyrus ussuriensis x Pyrus communis]|uniref:Uncharacterized protein n=1 Tax=Pyrus ussuriensis x Pyrus communis TaxID=2448454 RepID=A0A5N5GJ32_9ROSA|nr:hypothetical protein D8674_021735 [Pyrus ussuriensis x Pyrus communis]
MQVMGSDSSEVDQQFHTSNGMSSHSSSNAVNLEVDSDVTPHLREFMEMDIDELLGRNRPVSILTKRAIYVWRYSKFEQTGASDFGLLGDGTKQ